MPVQLTSASSLTTKPTSTHPAAQHLQKTHSVPVGGTTTAPSDLDPIDQDCLQRFLKLRVKQVTESDGTVPGMLLVTPNCLMFDPEMSHQLVVENGPDLYGMVAK